MYHFGIIILPTSNCSGTNNFKVFRHYTATTDGLVLTDQCVGGDHLLFYNQGGDQCHAYFTHGSDNAWHRYEFWYSAGTGNKDGFAYVWIDGVLQDSCTGLSIDSGLAQMRIGHYQQVGLNLDAYTDDVYIDKTRARVEVGNASTWSNCSHREIQIPSAWSVNSITFSFNQGSFNDGNTVYVYVVDANGNVNSNGYPIVIGGGGGPPPPPPDTPNPPTGLKIVDN